MWAPSHVELQGTNEESVAFSEKIQMATVDVKNWHFLVQKQIGS